MTVKSFDLAKPAPAETPVTICPHTARPATGAVQLTGFRHYEQPSLEFSASLVAGKVVTQGSHVGQDMAEQLNQLPRQFIQDATYAGHRQDLRLLDNERNVFHLQSTPAAAAVLKSSCPTGFLCLAPNNPGRAHLGQISGVYTTLAGEQFRLDQGRLLRFEPQTHCWLPDKDDARYNRLGLSSDGRLIKVPVGVTDMSVEGQAQVCLQPDPGGCALRIRHSAEGPVIHLLPVSETGERVPLHRIGMAGDTLYASTAQGELLRASLSTAQDGRVVMRPEPVEALEHLHQGAVSFKGFMHDDNGQLNALLLNRCKQLHSTPLINTSLQATGWNLSDVLLKVNDKGLPEPGLRALASAIDLGARGKVALEGSTLLSWDEHACQWEKTAHRDVDLLAPGLDGRAYVLQGSELKALASHKTRAPAFSGASYDLAPINDARNHVTLDATLTENTGRKIAAFAVDNARRFVTLDEHNQLVAHIDNKEIALTFAPPRQIQALALDRLGDLYARTRAGELLKLDKARWQTPPASALAWTTLALPGNARLQSLRMDASQRLVASWEVNGPKHKAFAEHYWQLSAAADGSQQWQPFDSQASNRAPSLASMLSRGEMKGQNNGTSWAVNSAVMGSRTEGLPLDRGFFSGARAHLEPLQGIKNIGLDIQHRANGRRGLAALYAQERELHGQLQALANTRPHALDMTIRLDRLSENASTQILAGELKAALQQVEACSEQLAMRLGDLKGAQLVPQMQACAEPSTGRLRTMCSAFENLAPSKTNTTAALLRSYLSQGVVLSPRNAGDKRDLSNPTGLLESDLILHARTLSGLADLIGRLERIGPDQSAIDAGLKAVMQYYQNSQVHQKTSQNINGLAQAETLYNNFKLLARDLGTPGSALNFHIARTLGLGEQQTVKQALLHALQASDSGQSITASRTKTKSMSVFVLPAPLLEIIAGASRSKTNGITMSRTNQGVSFDISMSTSHTAAASVGVGKVLPIANDLLEQWLRLGAETTLMLAHDKKQGVSFEVKEADFPAMMDILTGVKGDVFDLLDLGNHHNSHQRSQGSLDWSVSAHVQPRAQVVSPQSLDAVSGLARAMANTGASLHLLHLDKSNAVTLEESGITRTDGLNAQLLPKGGASLGGAPVNAAASVELNDSGSSWVAYTAADASFSLNFDGSKARAMRFTVKQPQVIEQAQIDTLRTEMSRHSPQLKQQLASLAAQGTPVEQLRSLQQLFGLLPPPPARSEEHHSLQTRLQDHLHQQTLAAQGLRDLQSIERTVSYVGFKGSPQHEWLNEAAPANKDAIVRLFAQQPQFARLLKDLESSQGASVVMELEVKPQVLRMIAQRFEDGPGAKGEMQKALENSDNLRVKNLRVSYTASRTHSLTTPVPLLAYTSSAMLGHTGKLLNIELKYGQDPDAPLRLEFKDILPLAPARERHPEQQDQNIRDARHPVI
ncbi:AvrE-family type 3 secretion system effector [Pseudomonas fragi]|uniref:AvrE-family type 3 secretion system effector n=1 Tax=Pseudomonas fragi TaxID=296 RepID=UPI001FD1303D|nr:AvrE-family type 3 secretion system effector [Pseudomonas fragi]